jgi:hypothetical protein
MVPADPTTGRLTDEGIERFREKVGVDRPRTRWTTTRDGIRQYAYGFGDDNPLWCDPDHAAGTRWACHRPARVPRGGGADRVPSGRASSWRSGPRLAHRRRVGGRTGGRRRLAANGDLGHVDADGYNGLWVSEAGYDPADHPHASGQIRRGHVRATSWNSPMILTSCRSRASRWASTAARSGASSGTSSSAHDSTSPAREYRAATSS